MKFDIVHTFQKRLGENYTLHRQYINPAWTKATQLIGYDKVYAKAEKCYLWDHYGKRYLDCVSGFCVSNIGHNHPVLRQALRDALNELFPNLIQLDCSLLSGLLAEALIQHIPWLDMVFFANSGSESIEAAIKFARCATGRQRILYADQSYHGVTYGALSVTGNRMWREGFEPLLPGMDHIPFGSGEVIERELSKGDVAGVLLEPIQVGAGIIIPPDEYFKQVERACRKYHTLFIVDEVHTGIGRTGTFLACEQWQIEPDIVCLSKGLSGGMVPVSAVVTRKEVIKRVYSRLDRSCVHASTFMGNNLAMISGLATLHVLETEDLLTRCRESAAYFMEKLKPFQDKYELVKQVRGRGLLIGVELDKPASTYLRNCWSGLHRVNPGLFAQTLTIPLLEDHAILTQVAGHNEDVLKIAPALVVTREDIDLVVKALNSVLTTIHSFPGPIWDLSKRLTKHVLRRV